MKVKVTYKEPFLDGWGYPRQEVVKENVAAIVDADPFIVFQYPKGSGSIIEKDDIKKVEILEV